MEHSFCDASNLIRFPSLPFAQVDGGSSGKVYLVPKTRRFYSSGYISTRFEVGLVRARRQKLELSDERIATLVRRVLSVPIKVPALNREADKVQFGSAGAFLASRFNAATAKPNSIHAKPTAAEIVACDPLVLLETWDDDLRTDPFGNRPVYDLSALKIRIAYFPIRYKGADVQAWHIHSRKGADNLLARSIRTILLQQYYRMAIVAQVAQRIHEMYGDRLPEARSDRELAEFFSRSLSDLEQLRDTGRRFKNYRTFVPYEPTKALPRMRPARGLRKRIMQWTIYGPARKIAAIRSRVERRLASIYLREERLADAVSRMFSQHSRFSSTDIARVANAIARVDGERAQNIDVGHIFPRGKEGSRRYRSIFAARSAVKISNLIADLLKYIEVKPIRLPGVSLRIDKMLPCLVTHIQRLVGGNSRNREATATPTPSRRGSRNGPGAGGAGRSTRAPRRSP
jgi:hypothetical protein